MDSKLIRKEEDKIVFKAILRCMKEEKNMLWPKHNVKGTGNFSEIIRRCYQSRDNHRGESFSHNIYYWPDDCGGLFNNSFTKFLYMAMLVNNLTDSGLIKSHLISYIKTLFENHADDLVANNTGSIISYGTIISNALIKCGLTEEQSKIFTNNLKLFCEAKNNNLPF